MSSKTEAEVFTQPEMWARAQVVANETANMPKPGEAIAVIGCGTSWFIAEAYCKLREAKGDGISDAYTATEFPLTRTYDRIICLSRSGTTTEIVQILQQLHGKVPTVLITAVTPGPATDVVDTEVLLDFADEESVVQTRFATSALIFFRASLGEDVTHVIEDCKRALSEPIPDAWVEATQISFLGTGWTHGLATEAGLKLREASQSWSESYYAMEYRHGPIAIAEPNRLVWVFGEVPPGMADQVGATGATLVTWAGDPLAMLVIAHRLAVKRAEAKGLNPDTPRHLTRSVILPS